MIRIFCAVVLLTACVINARVIEVDVSVPNSMGEVQCSYNDTISFSNGMTLGVHHIIGIQTPEDQYLPLYLAFLDAETNATYCNSAPKPKEEWYTDSFYNLSETWVPHLDVSSYFESAND